MNIQRSICTAISFATVSLIAPGCENAEAQREQEIQQVILTVGEQLREVSLLAASATIESTPQIRQNLNAMVNDLQQINQARGGQQAARCMLASTALQELARLDLDAADRMESQQRIERIVLHNKLSTALRLEGRSSGLSQLSQTEVRQFLELEQRSAAEVLHESSEALADLDGPLAETTRLNTEASRQVAELEQQANELRRQAAIKGHDKGLPDFLEALRREREADRIEYEMANREAVLNYEIQPEHRQADHRAQFARGRIDAIKSAHTSLANYTRSISTDTTTTEQSINQLRTTVRDRLHLLDQERIEGLSELYERAAETLTRATSEARRSSQEAGRDGALASQLLEIRLLARSGQLYWTKAAGLNDHASLLRRVSELETEWGGSTDWSAPLSAATKGHEQARNSAKEAFTGASESLSRINPTNSTGRDLIALQKGLTGALKGLEGEFAGEDTAPFADSRPPDRRSRSSSGQNSGRGFDTPEALLERLIELGSSPANTALIFDLYYAEDAAVRKRLKTYKRMTSAFGEVMNAIVEQFGTDALTGMSSRMPGMSGLSPGETIQSVDDLEIVEESENRMVYALPNSESGSDPLTLIKNNNRWFLQAPSNITELDPQTDQMMSMMSNSLSRLKPELKKIAERIRNDEFSTVTEAMMAMMKVMSGAMGGG